jgi:hypothetical protein
MVLGSKLNPVEVAVDTTLSSNDLGSKVVLREEPMGVKNVLEVEDQVVLSIDRSREE